MANVYTTAQTAWLLNNGLLTQDDSGNSNTITNSGVSADTGDKKEGDASGLFVAASNDIMTIADASLSADFPLKNGDTTKEITVAFWFKINTMPNSGQYVLPYSKWDAPGAKRSFIFGVVGTGSSQGRMDILIGYNGGASTEIMPDTSGRVLAENIWYHAVATFKDSTKAWTNQTWDDTNSNMLSSSGTSTNNINIEDAPVELSQSSSGGFFDGLMDEVVVFNRILTEAERTQIKDGTFGTGGIIQASMSGGMQQMTGGING